MPNKQISVFSNVVLPILVAGTTILLFMLFKPEDASVLFYTNLGYTLFIEAIYFGYLAVSRTKSGSLSTVFKVVLGVWAVNYVILGATWMLVFSLILGGILSFKMYLAIHVVLLLLWIIVASLVAQTDNNHKEYTDKIAQQGRTIQFYGEKFKLIIARYNQECSKRGLKASVKLEILQTTMLHMPPSIFRDETTCTQLNFILDSCELIVDELEKSEGEESVKSIDERMNRFAINATDELRMLKNMSRG